MPRLFVARLARRAVTLMALGASATAWAQGLSPDSDPRLSLSPAATLPAAADAALRRARLPSGALAAVVQDVQTGQRLLAWNETLPVNPASVFKLVTTYAALDRLGPAWAWRTPVWLGGPVRAGALEGSLSIKGSGDPKLVLERVWLLLRRLQQMGIQEIRGDIVLDNSAFLLPDVSPADFDGEAHRPYNVRPDALLLNYKALNLSFMPDPTSGHARVVAEPPLAGWMVDASVPLNPTAACGDWRGGLKATLADAGVLQFAGAYPTACADKVWPIAYAEPQSYNARLIEQLWRDMGGRLTGKVRAGLAPAGESPAFELSSPPLAELVRDINKFSNNVMAEQLFLTLAAATAADAAAPRPASGEAATPLSAFSPLASPTPPASAGAIPFGTALVDPSAPPAPAPVTPQQARETLHRWALERWGEAATRTLVVDNGSGLSRDTRVSADLMARLLQSAFSGPVMAELMASLPVSGTDGTLRRSTTTPGRAHLKTGSLRDVVAVAGYVLSHSGRRFLVVAMLNHPNAAAGRPALDALVQWAIDDLPAN